MKNKESKLQEACVKWFRYSYPDTIIHHSPNGGYRNAQEAVKFKRMGVMPGFPDLIITGLKKPLFIEMKADKGRLSDNQVKTISMLRNNRYEVHVIFSLDQFMEIVTEYMHERKSKKTTNPERPRMISSTKS